MHDFKKSLAIGQRGEAQLLLWMPELTKLDGRKADFINEQTGARYELKTDSYDYMKTSNLFVETTSDAARGTPGGPAQALSHGSKWWLYMYSTNKILLIFETEKLVNWLKENVHKYPLFPIKNNGWTTLGIILPREDVKHLYILRNFNDTL